MLTDMEKINHMSRVWVFPSEVLPQLTGSVCDANDVFEVVFRHHVFDFLFKEAFSLGFSFLRHTPNIDGIQSIALGIVCTYCRGYSMSPSLASDENGCRVNTHGQGHGLFGDRLFRSDPIKKVTGFEELADIIQDPFDSPFRRLHKCPFLAVPDQFPKSHGSDTVTDVFSGSEANIVVYESQLLFKWTNTALCLVALVNPSLEGNLTQQGQIPTHGKELTIMFLSILDKGLSGFIVAGKQFNQSRSPRLPESLKELFFNSLNVCAVKWPFGNGSKLSDHAIANSRKNC